MMLLDSCLCRLVRRWHAAGCQCFATSAVTTSLSRHLQFLQLLFQGLYQMLGLGRSLPVSLRALDDLLGLIFALDRLGNFGRLRLLAPLQLDHELHEMNPVWSAIEALSPLGLPQLLFEGLQLLTVT